MDGPAVRTLGRALEIMGTKTGLADALGVSVSDLETWLSGEAAPPHKVFIAALDIVARGAPSQH
jgi:hypothetical protein